MEGYYQLKMKRKELEDVNNDFSDLSLSSPARKIRRLDFELLPTMKEESSEMLFSYEHSVSEQSLMSSNTGGLAIEELPSIPENQERAIVLFKLIGTPLAHSPSNLSVSVNLDLVSGFKNQVLGSCPSNAWRQEDNEAATQDKNSGANNQCLAVVPWVPLQLRSVPVVEAPPEIDNHGMMDTEEVGEETMDIEADCVVVEQRNMNEAGGMRLSEGLHQWQQQHCLIPQPPHNTATPIVWYR